MDERSILVLGSADMDLVARLAGGAPIPAAMHWATAAAAQRGHPPRSGQFAPGCGRGRRLHRAAGLTCGRRDPAVGVTLW